MKRIAALALLLGFLLYTGTYIFVYLFRAFRLTAPAESSVVHVWHGDPMIRAVLVAVLFVIGLLLLLLLMIERGEARREGTVRLRPDLAAWLAERAETTNETADVIAERAVASYRAALEEGRPIGSSGAPY